MDSFLFFSFNRSVFSPKWMVEHLKSPKKTNQSLALLPYVGQLRVLLV